VKHQQVNVFKITSLCLVLLFLGLMSACITHAETYHFVTEWGSYGSGDGQFYSPTSVAVSSSGNIYVADRDNHRIQEFDNGGSFLTKWGSVGSTDGQFYYPRSIAVDSSGNVYVVDTDNNRVLKFDSNGTFLAKWGSYGSGNGQFSSPDQLAIDSSDNVYVADTGNNRIQKFDSKGKFLVAFGSSGAAYGEFYNPHGVAVDSSGSIYVADSDNHRIQKFDSSGEFLASWGSYGSGNKQFYYPQSVAVDSSGNVYVADTDNNRIQKLNSNGKYLTQWGSSGSGNGQFSSPQSVAVDSSGNVYVDDVYNCLIQKFDGSGTFLTQWGTWGSDDGQFFSPQGIAVDSSGNVYVADPSNHRIQKFDGSGTFLTKWSSYGSDDGLFYSPSRVAVDSSGNVYVADTSNHRIQKFDSSGTFLTKWGSYGSDEEQFINPQGIAVDSSGNVYVADTENCRIQKFDSNGTFLTQWGTWGSGHGQFYYPISVAVDSSGKVYVVDKNNHYIQKFNSIGKYITQWGSYGSDDGQFINPCDVAIDSSGNVYVADMNNHRIQKFDSNGTYLTQWGSYGGDDGLFSSPWSIAIDSYGNVYVADTGNNRIQKFANDSFPVANFTSNVTSGFAPLTVQFTDLSKNATSWNWNFGDGDTSTKQNPVHTFLAAGTYTVNLTVGNENGTNSKVATISVGSLSYYSVNGHYYNAVSVPEGITWSDAKTASESSTYLGMNGHLATITSQGENDFIYNNLGVTPNDYWLGAFQPDGSQEPDGDWQWVTGEPWDYTNWDPGEPTNDYEGGYGDLHPWGYPEDALQFHYNDKWNDVTHDFLIGGYVVEYEPTPTNNTSVLPVANFSTNVSEGYAPLLVEFTDLSENATSWFWDFGDGTNATEQNVSHTYTSAGNYTVNLTVSNADGSDSEVKTDYIVVGEPLPGAPVANFTATPTSGTVPLTVNFTDQSTGTVSSYAWDFNYDGNVDSTEQSPSYTYGTAGTYTVNLTVIGPGGSDFEVKTGYIKVTGSSPGKPVAAFSASPASGKAPLTVAFTDTSTGTPTKWKWSFGDGTSSTQQNPVHKYSKAGKYTVSLTVTNAKGSNTVTETDYIKVTANPVANFTSSVTLGKAPLSVVFTDTSTGTPATWKWTFGDGTSSTVQNPTHKYSKAGTYTVNLTVKNAAGSNTVTKTDYIKVTEKPAANFTSSVTSGKAPLSVVFTDTSTGTPATWKWTFGDGTSSTQQNPVHKYSKAGTYTVILTVKNAIGSNTATKTDYIKVTAKPVAEFSATPTSGKMPLTVAFTDTSTGLPTKWKWNFGDGTSSTIQNPKHKYSKAGSYTVTLTATNAAGSSMITKTDYIKVTTNTK